MFAVAKPEDIAPAVDAAKASGAETLNFLASALFFPVNRIDIERATAVRLPAIHHWPEAAEGGGFLAYGPRFTQVWRQRARLTIKILRGDNPADLPVEQMLDRVASLGIEAVELGTGNYPGNSHCDPDELLGDSSKQLSLLQAVEDRISGEPLDASGEAAARVRGWQP